MKKLTILLFALAISVLLAACSSGEDNSSDSAGSEEEQESQGDQTEAAEGTQAAQEDVEVSDEEKVDEGKVVATVNGTEIVGEEYNSLYVQTKIMLQQYQQDTSDTDLIKTQTLDTLISQELIKQEAEAKGITVEDQEVADNIEQIKSQYEDDQQFKDEFLDKLQLSEDGLKEQVAYELRLQKYMDEELPEVEITDKQVEDYYAQLESQSENVPKLEDIQSDLKDQLAQQEKQQKLNEVIQELKDNGEVEKLI
ncbi:SurA N-terminal domain-containing protein [Aquibacillus sp. 3ASR75-11]|uniref:SurA N-terminal domain-containing protein n=1 Tax=Terrihalobacillus insolitus TaxID=2950438 RepID=A0A9X3WS11_9BACI|nr:SurA N-terminal domain-containing protein [Terrihalobacillus insolitus]MDC3412091.1 SurA N-terminal domain-containing protein [Terrihalobacillus insolitus]MDC3423216.1 SurA N-terminal domain-containing protein [Terrihalobacillus insolitus]